MMDMEQPVKKEKKEKDNDPRRLTFDDREQIIDEIEKSVNLPKEEKHLSVAVLGVGNIGKSLLRALHKCNNFDRVLGVDIYPVNMSGLEETLIDFHVIKNKDYSILKDIDIVVVCVPSKFRIEKDHLIDNINEIIKLCTQELDLKAGAALIVETTLPLGTMNVIVDKLEEKGVILGEDLFLGYCPERFDQTQWSEIGDQVRVVSANDHISLTKVSAFYQSLGCDTTELIGMDKAEAIKLYENFSRLAQIEFANIFAKFCVSRNLPPIEILLKAMTKTNVQTVLPGIVGGHCLPEAGLMVSTAYVDTILDSVAHAGRKRLKNAKSRIEAIISPKNSQNDKEVLFLGQGYKPGVADTTGSPAVELAFMGSYPVIYYDLYEKRKKYPLELLNNEFEVIVVFHRVPFYIKIIEKFLSPKGLLIDFTGAFYGLPSGEQSYYFP